MKIFKNLKCWGSGHIWVNDNSHPVHGYNNKPYPDSYCKNCGKVAGK